jgi:hypothetical protein
MTKAGTGRFNCPSQPQNPKVDISIGFSGRPLKAVMQLIQRLLFPTRIGS